MSRYHNMPQVMLATSYGWRFRRRKNERFWEAPREWPLRPKRVSGVFDVVTQINRYRTERPVKVRV